MNKTTLIALILAFSLHSCNESKFTDTTEVAEEADTAAMATEEFAHFQIVAEGTEVNNEDNRKIVMAATETLSHPCDAVLNVVHQRLLLKSDRQLLEKLEYLYEATSSQDLQSRKRSTFGLEVPDYLSAAFGTNRSKVRQIRNAHKNEVDFSLSNDERIDLNSTYSRSEDVQAAIQAWERCMIHQQGIAYLDLGSATKESVSMTLKMPYSDRRSVRATKIIYSKNLKLVKGDITGKKLFFPSEHSLNFERTDINEGFVKVDLSEGSALPLSFPKYKEEHLPILDKRLFSETYTAVMEIDLKSRVIKITSPDGSIESLTFAKQKKAPYKLSFNVKTKIQNPHGVIKDYYYTPIDGTGIGRFEKKGVKLEPDGTLSFDCYLITSGVKMIGRFGVEYGITKEVCVQYCEGEDVL